MNFKTTVIGFVLAVLVLTSSAFGRLPKLESIAFDKPSKETNIAFGRLEVKGKLLKCERDKFARFATIKSFLKKFSLKKWKRSYQTAKDFLPKRSESLEKQTLQETDFRVTNIKKTPRGIKLTFIGEKRQPYRIYWRDSLEPDVPWKFAGWVNSNYYSRPEWLDEGNVFDNRIFPLDKSVKQRFYQIRKDASEVVEVNQDITGYQVWKPGKIYKVTTHVAVSGILVIEPGTLVKYSRGQTAIWVNNGGTLIAAGRPNQRILFTSNEINPTYGDYVAAIVIQKTASEACRICYSDFEFAWSGIIVENKRLNTPITHNRFRYCYFAGVYESLGPKLTDITNNLFIDCGYWLWDFNYGWYMAAIMVNTRNINDVSEPGTEILIKNNTIDYAYHGIFVRAGTSEANAPVVAIWDNVITNAMWSDPNYPQWPSTAITLYDGEMIGDVNSNGYYNNLRNKNFNFPEENPVVVTESPYVSSADINRKLKQDCDFIDAGFSGLEEITMWPELVGFTTASDNRYDKGVMDLGYHSPSLEYKEPENPDLPLITITSPSNGEVVGSDLSGDVDILAEASDEIGTEPGIDIVVYHLDGMYLELGDLNYYSAFWETNQFPNGIHELQAFACDYDGNIKSSAKILVKTDNLISNFYCQDNLGAGENLNIVASFEYSTNFGIQVSRDDAVVWSYAATGENANVSWSGIAGLDDGLYYVKVSPNQSTGSRITPLIFGCHAEKETTKSTINFDQIEVIIFCPNRKLNKMGEVRIPAVEKAAKDRGLKYRTFVYKECTYQNLKKALLGANSRHIYMHAHGNWRFEKKGVTLAERTMVEIHDDVIFSFLWDDWDLPEGSRPSWSRKKLPGDWDKKGKSMWKLRLFGSGKIEIAFLDSCYSGRKEDMAMALGMFSNWNYTYQDQVYIGWKKKAYVPTGLMDFIKPYNKFVEDMWAGLGGGDSVDNAITNAQNTAGSLELADNITYQGPDLIGIWAESIFLK